MAGNPRKLKAVWSAEMAADFAGFHGSKSYIPYGEDFLEPGTMFKVKDFPQEDSYVVIEKHKDHHIIFSNVDEQKITHDGGIDIKRIEIYEENNDGA